MTGSELEDSLKLIGWHKADLAERLGVNPNTVSTWARDGVPAHVEEYVNTMADLFVIVEAPRLRRKRTGEKD